MRREQILDEIRRTATENGGVPLGLARFNKETGITRETWLGKYWRRWSEAVAEAGFVPNERSKAVERDDLLRGLALLTRENGRFPTDAEIGMARTNGAQLPHHHRFRKLGDLATRVQLLRAYAQQTPEFADIVTLLAAAVPSQESAVAPSSVDGAVYMLKLGRHYKIGKSFRVPQRHREIAIELPEKPDIVHVIPTDDPSGIESYWHGRFAQKRTNGEWFALSLEDVRVFRRRRFM